MGDSASQDEVCEQKLKLLDIYAAATAEYGRTVGVLHRRGGVLPEQTYAAIQQASEKARLRSEQARLNLALHVLEHGC